MLKAAALFLFVALAFANHWDPEDHDQHRQTRFETYSTFPNLFPQPFEFPAGFERVTDYSYDNAVYIPDPAVNGFQVMKFTPGDNGFVNVELSTMDRTDNPNRGPTKRDHAATLYWSGGGVVHGGIDVNNQVLNDLWFYNNKDDHWTNYDMSGPARYGHSIWAWNVTSFAIFGGAGQDGMTSSALMIYNFATARWESWVAQPTVSACLITPNADGSCAPQHISAVNAFQNYGAIGSSVWHRNVGGVRTCMSFGGASFHPLNAVPIYHDDMFTLEFDAQDQYMWAHWAVVDNYTGNANLGILGHGEAAGYPASPFKPKPSGRMLSASTFRLGEKGGELWIHGGEDQHGRMLSDFYVYNFQTGCWREVIIPTIGVDPTNRVAGKMHCYNNDVCFVYGGVTDGNNANQQNFFLNIADVPLEPGHIFKTHNWRDHCRCGSYRHPPPPPPPPTPQPTPGPTPDPTPPPTPDPTPDPTPIPTPEPTPESLGCIRGRVFRDYDCTASPNQQRLHGVPMCSVRLYNARDSLLHTTLTDEFGNFMMGATGTTHIGGVCNCIEENAEYWVDVECPGNVFPRFQLGGKTLVEVPLPHFFRGPPTVPVGDPDSWVCEDLDIPVAAPEQVCCELDCLRISVPCYLFGDMSQRFAANLGPDAGPDPPLFYSDTLVSLLYRPTTQRSNTFVGPNRDQLNFDITIVAEGFEIGSTWSAIWHRPTNNILASTMFRRHCGNVFDPTREQSLGSIFACPIQFVDQPADAPVVTGCQTQAKNGECRTLLNLQTLGGLSAARDFSGPRRTNIQGNPSNGWQDAFYDYIADNNAGNDPDFPGGGPMTVYDGSGKVALGGMAISSDMKTLFIQDIHHRRLVSVTVGRDLTETNVNFDLDLMNTAGVEPNCANNAVDFRPWAVTYHDNRVYFGGTCTAESTIDTSSGLWTGRQSIAVEDQNAPSDTNTNFDDLNDLDLVTGPGARFGDRTQTKAVLWSMNLDTQAIVKAIEFGLDYPKGPAMGEFNGYFRAWAPGWILGHDPSSRLYAWPQPLFTDLEFDGTDVNLGFLDRFGLQIGHNGARPNQSPPDFEPATGAAPRLYIGSAGGDTLRACSDFGDSFDPENPKFALEGNALCQGTTRTGAQMIFDQGRGVSNGSPESLPNAPQGEGPLAPGSQIGQEYFWFDFFTGASIGLHREITLGGLAQLHGDYNLVSSAFDPFDFAVNSGGLVWFNNTNGNKEDKVVLYQVAEGDRDGLAKAVGIGEPEILCLDEDPMILGDRLWVDTNGDGRQQLTEPGVAGAVVQLFQDSETGTMIQERTTNANGYYTFEVPQPLDSVIEASRTYFIKTNVPAGHAITILQAPRVNERVNSDARDGGSGTAVAGPFEHRTSTHPNFKLHDIDMGFVPV